MNHYHPTTTQEGIDFDAENNKALSQELVILGLYYTTSKPMTANDVFAVWSSKLQAIGKQPPLLTSVRRAITNLKNQKYLEIKNSSKAGPYGKPVHFYTITSLGMDYASENNLNKLVNKPKPLEAQSQMTLF